MNRYLLIIWCFFIGSTVTAQNVSENYDIASLDSLEKLSRIEQILYAKDYEHTADSFFHLKELKSAELYYNMAYRIYFSSDSLLKAGRVLLRLASLYQLADFAVKAEESTKQANAIFMAIDDDIYQYQSLCLLAEFSFDNKDWLKFDLYAELVENKAREIDDAVSLAKILSLRGNRYKRDSVQLAKRYFNDALKLLKFSMSELKADIAFSLGTIYLKEKKTETAVNYFNQALVLYKEFDLLKKEAKATYFIGLAFVYQSKASPYSEEQFMKTYSIATNFQYYDLASRASKQLSRVYSFKSEFDKALYYYEDYLSYSDSAHAENNKVAYQLLKDKYEIKRRDKILSIQEADIYLQQENNREWNMRIVVIIIILLIVVLSIVFVYYVSYRRQKNNEIISRRNVEIVAYNEEIEQQKEELEKLNAHFLESKEEILVQKNMLEVQTAYLNEHSLHIRQQQDDLMKNLEFAYRLQASMMPPERKMKALLRDYFLINLPQYVVSGDFYWIKRLDSDRLLVVVADSTGHGVPGALMSVLGLAYLNELVKAKPVVTAAEVLEKLRVKVKGALRTSVGNMQKDGFDLAVCIVEKKSKQLQFAGALAPLYIVRSGKLQVVKSDRFPVGNHVTFEKPFVNHIVDTQVGDMVYMFSDGIKDQFGGDSGKKFSSKRLRSLLTEVSHLPLDEQEAIINHRIEEWKGRYEQTDDLILLGIRL